MTRIERINIRLWWVWQRVRDWCLRWVYAQTNARVIIDFEERMTGVIHAATGGLMSKPYYELRTMLPLIEEAREQAWADGYADGRRDLCEEAGIADPNPPVTA